MKKRGVITKYDTGRKFGFIRFGHGKTHHDDLFFHSDSVVSGAERLSTGAQVVFNIEQAEKGPRAIEVEVRKAAVNPLAFFLGATAFILIASMFIMLQQFPRITPLGCYAIAVNLALFVMLGYDKGIAGSTTMRVPELVLFGGAAIGGGFGILLAMKMFRHKTKKTSFRFVVALILVLQFALLRFLFGSVKLGMFVG
jgi:uncharacterized membrane protein YsdA (DUF1294 family)/cold shock CspA family protein